jgi:cobalamin-dependent methionine synthase I
MITIGERINSTRKPISAALEARDAGHILNKARRQWDAGSDYYQSVKYPVVQT